MATAPVKNKRSGKTNFFIDYIIMIMAPCVMAIWNYRGAAVKILAVSIVTAVVCDILGSIICGKKYFLNDLSGVYTAAALALMMPATVPVYIPIAAASFAILVAKLPFGGGNRAPFVPAAAGFAFATVCFGEKVFEFSPLAAGSTSFDISQMLTGSRTLASMLADGDAVYLNFVNFLDIAGGNVVGPMGTTCGLLMAGCCAYLFVRRRKALLATLGMIGMCALVAVIFPRTNASFVTNLVMELSAGSLMFAAVFLLTDNATLPKGGSLNLIIYGAVCGLLCMAMRYIGAYEETVCFAVLLANGARPLIDKAADGIKEFFSKKGLHKKKKPVSETDGREAGTR